MKTDKGADESEEKYRFTISTVPHAGYSGRGDEWR